MNERTYPPAGSRASATAADGPVANAILFDAKGDDHEIDLSDVAAVRYGAISCCGSTCSRWATRTSSRYSTAGGSRGCAAVSPPSHRSAVRRDHGGFLHVEVAALADPDDSEPVSIVCVVGNGWVVTTHAGPVPFLQDFRERASAAVSSERWMRLPSWPDCGVAIDYLQRCDRGHPESIDDLDQGPLGQSPASHRPAPPTGRTPSAHRRPSHATRSPQRGVRETGERRSSTMSRAGNRLSRSARSPVRSPT